MNCRPETAPQLESKTYDVNAVFDEENPTHCLQRKKLPIWVSEMCDDGEMIYDETDADAVICMQFEDGLVDALQSDPDIAACYNTCLDAARRGLFDRNKNRGFWNSSKGSYSSVKGKSKGRGKGFQKGRKPLAQRILESECRRCGAKGDWKAECPLNRSSNTAQTAGGSKDGAFAGAIMTVHAPDDLDDDVIWAPVDLLQSASGTTCSWGSLLTTNGACMRKQSDHQAGGWDEMLRRGRNKAMHSSNGNSSMFFLLLSLLIACSSAMLTARASTVDLLFFVNLFSCIFSLQCAMKLCSTRKRCRNHISRCRFVRNQRKKVFHRLHRWNRMRWALLGLCLASPLVMMTIKASQYVSPMSTPTFPKGTTWCLSRKKRNQLTYSLVGNTVVSRTRWESTTEAPGIQLHAPEELALPGDAAPQELRASQVSNGAVGYSFCNQVELTPKLSVKGGSYLVLLVPGALGSDLRKQLQGVSPTLAGNCRGSCYHVL